ncbi:hypothetical protein RFW18_20830 [Metabacillus idriensis]|uniref:hypothetical protein n=1 Tax=Metabacillus idriensis TaxID=324768 RepID=UPI002812944B|nr:hypothetical protein [Metabacillus idriensis]MDR0140209.1 hypothetical protein [Metabacillus idriensis]
MDRLKIVCGLIAICLWMILLIQTSRFNKEFKKAINEDRSLSEDFIQRWDKKSSRELILIIVASIFSLTAILLSWS